MNATTKRKAIDQNHAPSRLRETLQEWLDSYEPDRLSKMEVEPVADLLNALENCGDVLPAPTCDQLEIPKGSSYAEAVENLRRRQGKHRSSGMIRLTDLVAKYRQENRRWPNWYCNKEAMLGDMTNAIAQFAVNVESGYVDGGFVRVIGTDEVYRLLILVKASESGGWETSERILIPWLK